MTEFVIADETAAQHMDVQGIAFGPRATPQTPRADFDAQGIKCNGFRRPFSFVVPGQGIAPCASPVRGKASSVRRGSWRQRPAVARPVQSASTPAQSVGWSVSGLEYFKAHGDFEALAVFHNLLDGHNWL